MHEKEQNTTYWTWRKSVFYDVWGCAAIWIWWVFWGEGGSFKLLLEHSSAILGSPWKLNLNSWFAQLNALARLHAISTMHIDFCMYYPLMQHAWQRCRLRLWILCPSSYWNVWFLSTEHWCTALSTWCQTSRAVSLSWTPYILVPWFHLQILLQSWQFSMTCMSM